MVERESVKERMAIRILPPPNFLQEDPHTLHVRIYEYLNSSFGLFGSEGAFPLEDSDPYS